MLQRFALPHKPTLIPFPLSATSASIPYKNTIQHDTSQSLNQQETTRIQQIIGCLLYYARVLDSTLLKAFNTISQTQEKPSTTTKKLCDHLLNCCATKPNVGLRYYASNMTFQYIISCSSRR